MIPAVSLLATAVFTSTTVSAAPTPGQAFYLKLASTNTLLSNAVLRDNNTYDLGVTPAPYYDNPPYGDHPSPISISTSNSDELIVSPTNPHPGPIAGRLALVSTDIAGDWTLSKAFSSDGVTWNVGPNRDGVEVKVNGWGFEDVEGMGTTLGWGEGKWIAVKGNVTPFEGAPYERWVVHFLEASAAIPIPSTEFVYVDVLVSPSP